MRVDADMVAEHARLNKACGAGYYSRAVEFSRDLRADVLASRINVTYRLCRQPKVKTGGHYRVGTGQIEVDSIELVPCVQTSSTPSNSTGALQSRD
jgi:hypothetical protein